MGSSLLRTSERAFLAFAQLRLLLLSSVQTLLFFARKDFVLIPAALKAQRGETLIPRRRLSNHKIEIGGKRALLVVTKILNLILLLFLSELHVKV